MAWDNAWERVFQNQEWGKYPAETLIRFVAGNFYRRPDRSEVSVMEVGCGPGANIWFLAREGFSAYGIDGSPTAIEKAREMLVKARLEAELTVGDIVRLPYADGKFDAVLDSECLYANSAENTALILREIHRVLKTGGLLYSRTLTSETYPGKTHETVGRLQIRNSSDGPLAGKGFARLMDRNDISLLYGDQFDILSVDKLVWTINNGKITSSEWIIVCQKR